LEILKHSREAFEHLYSSHEQSLENLLLSFNSAFFTNTQRREYEARADEFPFELLKIIIGDNSAQIYEKYFDKSNKKFNPESYENIFPKLKLNFLKSIKELFY